jgi:lipoprotein-anchoring transpeptidase ErfK/SrfK
MGRDLRIRASWTATLVAGALALGATTGVVSITGHPRGEVALAAAGAPRPFADQAGPARVNIAVARVAGAAASRPSRHHHRRLATTHLLVRVPSAMTVRARPTSEARAVGTMPSSSKYYHVALTAWVEVTANHGRWGQVVIPYTWPRRDGWIPLRGLRRSQTHVEVQVDLSRHWVTVTKFGKTLFGVRGATGTPTSPTPTGHYFVTDRIPFSAGGPLGSFAFGISGIQPRLPAGWSGGNQLAIHGTSDPSSIGRSASAGCIRVSERTLHRLLPLLKLGTPIVITR